jgi:hypothetical protein
VSSGRPVVLRLVLRAVLRAVLLAPAALTLCGCSSPVEGTARPAPVTSTPETVADLGALIVTQVPSGLPRLADSDLDPPAGAKTVDDVATYADDPVRERGVLESYGYRHGWERFWGSQDGPLTSVFVDQFEHRAGAGAYAADLAHNDAEHYSGMLRENPAELPGSCLSLTVADPEPELGLHGPAAFAWCAHGDFSIGVTAVADSVDAAEEEMRAVVVSQFERLPPG